MLFTHLTGLLKLITPWLLAVLSELDWFLLPGQCLVISCVCRADSWSRYFTLYVQWSIEGVVDILENTYLLMSVSFLSHIYEAMCSHTIILLSWKSGVDLNPSKQLGQWDGFAAKHDYLSWISIMEGENGCSWVVLASYVRLPDKQTNRQIDSGIKPNKTR